jgi:cyclohexadieny/prephenate dehydrogenase
MISPSMAEPVFQRLCIIGIGLIGSSVARVARARGGMAGVVVATDASALHLERARDIGFADVVQPDLAAAAQGCDAVMLSVPVGGCIVTDTGSTKGSVIRDIAPHLPPGVHLVPGHPMAGTEFSGPDAGFAELFEGRYCILTPNGADPDATARVAEFWRRAGSTVDMMDPATHDKVVAIVSHLPHLIAFTICSTADDLAQETREAVLKFAASGFRDFTRIASSDVDMWRDVFLNNREAVLEMLARFTEDSQALGRAIRWGERDFIEDRIRRGRKIRRGLIERKQA